MRKLLGLLRLADVVYTKDHDGAVRLRLVRVNPWGERTVHGIGWCSGGQLMRDGTVLNVTYPYVQKWKPYRIRHEMSAWLEAPTSTDDYCDAHRPGLYTYERTQK